MSAEDAPEAPPRTWPWAVAYFSALAGMVGDANFDLLEDPWHWMLKALVLVLVVPMVVSARRQTEWEGPASRALSNYNFRVLCGVGAFVLACTIAARAYHSLPPGSPWLWLLALGATIPILFLIWAAARYLAEETDEYRRHLVIMGALIGLAAVLVLATLWGLLEELGLVPHVRAWLLVPFFAIAYGIGRAWLRTPGR